MSKAGQTQHITHVCVAPHIPDVDFNMKHEEGKCALNPYIYVGKCRFSAKKICV